MRVVALLVVVCSCRVSAVQGIDATTPVGDGLPERVITDSRAWVDVRNVDTPADAGMSDRRNDADDADDASGNADAAGDGPGAVGLDADDPCQLLASSCPDRQACYPYPFESAAPGQSRCAFQGVGGSSVPCQSQLECDGLTICAAPGRSDSVCLSRCDPLDPRCPQGADCFPLPNYPGVGVCR